MAKPLIQAGLIVEIIFITGIETAIDFAVRNKMLKASARNQDNHKDQIKKVSLLLIAAHDK